MTMNKAMAACVSAAAIAGATIASPAMAKPTTPEAAQTESGSGCLVADANGNYLSDPACDFHTVIQRDSNGQLIMFKYQDHGNLPAGAPAPATGQHRTFMQGQWDCSETTTPSGGYSSSCSFENR